MYPTKWVGARKNQEYKWLNSYNFVVISQNILKYGKREWLGADSTKCSQILALIL